MKQRILCICLLLAMLISCLPSTAWAATALPSNAVTTYVQLGDYISIYPAKNVNGSTVSYTDFSLSGQNGGNMAGQNVHLWQGGTASKWLVRRMSNGSFALATSNFEETQDLNTTSSMFYWDIQSKSTSVGAKIHVWGDNDLNDDNKLFYLVENNDGDPETFYIASYYTLSKGVTRYLAPDGFFDGTSWATDGCKTVLSDKGFPWRIHIVGRDSGNAMPTDVAWMDTIPDCTPLANINIPGTHDSAATNTDDISLGDASVARCQKLFLDEQLFAGIRALDIRLGYNDNTVTLNHSMITCYHKDHGTNKGKPLTLDYALSTAKSFLAKYPSETVIMVIKQDSGDSTVVTKALSILNSYKSVLYDWSKDSPSLGDVRGKIVIMSRLETSTYPTYLGPDLRKWDDNYNDDLHFAQKINTQSGQSANAATCGVWIQDDYSCSPDNKKLQFLNTAKQLNGKLGTTDGQTPAKIAKTDFVFNYNSLATSVHVTTPLVASRTMNAHLLAEVANQGYWNVGSRMGIVMLDFADKSLASRIIDSNKEYSSLGHSYSNKTTYPTCTVDGYTLTTCSICGYSYKSNIFTAPGHDYTSVTVEVTCTTDGYTTHTCNVCNYSYVSDEIPASGHNYKIVELAPSCTKAGYTSVVCAACGDVKSHTITEASGHNYIPTVTPPSCNQKGYTTYTCSGCSDSYVTDELPALEHSYTSVVTPPTCSAKGYTTYTCKNCGHSYTDNEVAKLDHDYSSVVTPPTCSAKGYTTYTCKNCGHSYTDNEVAKLDHDYTSVVTPPTCYAKGYTTYTCKNCSHSYKDNEVAKLDHDYTCIVTPPTCTEGGYATRTCKNCGHSYVSDHTEPSAHNYQITSTPPSCTEGGYITYTCKDCGHSYVSEQPETGAHTYDAVVTYPTCLEGGYTTYTCSVCNHTYVANETAPYGHDYVGSMVYPTCMSEGYTIYTCTICNESYVAERIEKTDHDYIAKITYPTCTQKGYTTYTCEMCNDTYIADETEAYDHDYIASVVSPTCNQTGYTLYTCAECGTSYKANETAALGHTLTYTSNHDGTHRVSCKRNCGFSLEQTCIYVDNICICGSSGCTHETTETQVTGATCTTDGTETLLCISCGTILATNTVPATGHNIAEVAAKPATCTENGLNKHWACTKCGNYFADLSGKYSLPESFAVIPALGHSYSYSNNGLDHLITCTNGCTYQLYEPHTFEEGVCLCGAVEGMMPKFDENLRFSMNIAAGVDISISYNIMASAVSQYADFYLEIKKDRADGESSVTTYGIGGDHIPLGNMANVIYYATYNGITAKEMGDHFATTLYAVGADGTLYYGNTVTSSIKDFLLSRFDDANASTEMKTMAIDMLRYGAAAQVRFDYDTENLVTADLTAEHLAYATTTIPDAVDHYVVSGNGANVSTLVTVGSRVELSLTSFISDVSDPSAVRCEIRDLGGNLLATPAVSNVANVIYTADYSNVGAREMRKPITATFFEGDRALSKTATWSVESFVAQTRSNANATQAEINMVNAMLIYGDSVGAYLMSLE